MIASSVVGRLLGVLNTAYRRGKFTDHVDLNLCLVVSQMGEEQAGHREQSDIGDGRRG